MQSNKFLISQLRELEESIKKFERFYDEKLIDQPYTLPGEPTVNIYRNPPTNPESSAPVLDFDPQPSAPVFNLPTNPDSLISGNGLPSMPLSGGGAPSIPYSDWSVIGNDDSFGQSAPSWKQNMSKDTYGQYGSKDTYASKNTDKQSSKQQRQPVQPVINNITNNNTYITKHRDSGILPMYFPAMQKEAPTVIIVDKSGESKKEKKEEKEDDSPSAVAIVVGTVAMGTLMAVSTYLATQDEYVHYWRSESDGILKMLTLTNETDESSYKNDFMALEKDYRNWESSFAPRTKKNFIGKGGVLVSAGTSITGLYFGAMVGVGGVLGAVGFGCYLYWNHSMNDKSREIRQFNALKESIRALLSKLENDSITVPSNIYPDVPEFSIPEFSNSSSSSMYSMFSSTQDNDSS